MGVRLARLGTTVLSSAEETIMTTHQEILDVMTGVTLRDGSTCSLGNEDPVAED